jgi:hypothetical protein
MSLKGGLRCPAKLSELGDMGRLLSAGVKTVQGVAGSALTGRASQSRISQLAIRIKPGWR